MGIKTQQLTAASQGLSDAIPARVNPKVPFFYAIAPEGWAWDAEAGTFLPILKRIPIDPGVLGVGADMDPTPAVVGFTKRKWICILPDDEKLPKKYQEYTHEAPHQGGGGKARFVVSTFEKDGIEIVGDRVYIEKDSKAEYAFKLWLVKNYPGCSLKPPIRRQLVRDQEERVSRIVQRVSKNPMNGVTQRRLIDEAQKLCAMKGVPFRLSDFYGLPEAAPATAEG